MCGFAGFTYSDKNLLKEMGKTLKKRAIDNEYFLTREQYSFYHAHLKISDLDKDTAQPYVSDTLIVGLVGEIYNKEEILLDIGVLNSAESYTELEVLALAYESLGESFIDIINGEFAISVFDIVKRKHILYRDRWGVNNLYYSIHKGELHFASEIKALILNEPVCCKKSMVDHLIFQFGISPETIVKDIFSLRPGTYIVFQEGDFEIKSFNPYVYRDVTSSIIETLEKSIRRRIPYFQDKIFLGLSGGPDSNLILHFLRKYFKGEIIAYSFSTEKNKEDINIAVKNAKKQGIKHLIIPMDDYEHSLEGEDLYTHEGLVHLPDLGKILKEKFPEYKDIKVEFGGDGKEELILGNNHYPYKEIFARSTYFSQKGLSEGYEITQEFLNKEMFDYNLQMIDKLTLRSGIERRLPFTDYEMLRFFKYKNYRKEAEDFLHAAGLEVVRGEYGYDLGIKFENLYDLDLARNKDILLGYFQKNVVS